MNAKNKIPAIRFKGFSGEWCQSKLEQTVICIVDNRGKNPKYYCSSGIPVIDNFMIKNTSYPNLKEASRFIDEYLFNNFIRNYNELDDILITLVGNGIGNITLFPTVQSVIIQNTLGLRFANNKKFMFYCLLFKNREIVHLDRGMAQPSIRQDELLGIDINSPSEETEQTKIGNYFQQLDTLIALHQKKHDKLLNLKKALLEKLFPKQGATEPEIRFKGFSGEWEEICLDDFGTSTSGTSIESEFSENGKYKVISIGSYSEKSEYTDQGIRAGHSDKTQKRILNKNDLTMILNDKTLAGNIIGRTLLIKEDDSYIYNQRTQRIEPYFEKYKPQFLYQLLNAPLIRSKIVKSSQGNTQIYVNWSSIKKLTYCVPHKTEQTKIGNLFKQLDTLITQHQTQLKKLGNIKQACLEKMFV